LALKFTLTLFSGRVPVFGGCVYFVSKQAKQQ
jgi:hypothetical protein